MKIDLGFRKIESQEQLIKWAEFINHGFLSTGNKCDLQDIWAHSGHNEILQLFMDCNNRKLVLCSVYNTMGYDEVERLLKYFAKQKGGEIAEKEITKAFNKINIKEIELLKKEQTFRDCRKSYWKKMNKLQTHLNSELETNKECHNIISKLISENIDLQRKLKECQEKANKFDTIKNTLII